MLNMIYTKGVAALRSHGAGVSSVRCVPLQFIFLSFLLKMEEHVIKVEEKIK